MHKLNSSDVTELVTLVTEGLHDFMLSVSKGDFSYSVAQTDVVTVSNALAQFMQTHNTWELHKALTSTYEGEFFASAAEEVSDFCC